MIASSRAPGTLAYLAAQTGARAALSSQAADEAELVIVAIPHRAVPELPAGFLDGMVPGAPVVDTGNYYPRERDGLIAAIEAACRKANG